MVDYTELRKELYEKFHDAYHKLYVSELKDQIAEKNAEIESLQIRIKDLERMLGHADWLVQKYREEIDE
jgi:superoxide dismutase